MLVLFDIDGTLLTGDGIGMRALTAAAQDLFGTGFTSDGISYAGRLDPLIIEELLGANGVPPTAQNRDQLTQAYYHSLTSALASNTITPLPGAAELVNHLAAVPAVTVGLLTGNLPESGRRKLIAAGFDLAQFRVCVWGDDSPHSPPHRNHLPAIAMQRFAQLHSREIDPSSIIVIGDTPGDIECAHQVGGRCLGVSTGRFGTRQLRDAGADLVVETLQSTADLANWILSPTPAQATMER